ncbi:YciI family protein [Microlunatus sp. Gsoil 973]|uniref:YciI family protein n=1 Tax=Microlunatus sp. Gsoil 973 TaxID=2672569 RepID=UPI001E614A01|nr:YciI family protein [Microlunatus sp. Gsoil 973]
MITDGPYADTKEVFAGYYIVEEDDLDSVIDIVRAIPAARLGGAVEVRPVDE